MKNLVFGLLDTSARFPDRLAADRARDLSIAWTRFKYTGVIFEAPGVDPILQRAAESQADFCLVQAYGVLLAEVWRPDHAKHLDIVQAITAWTEDTRFLVSGLAETAAACFLVNLNRYKALGCPAFGEDSEATGLPLGWNFIRLSQATGLQLSGMPAGIRANVVHLDPKNPAAWSPLPASVASHSAGEPEPVSSGSDFLAGIQRLTTQLPQGIFVWNLESYADIEQPSEHFKPPLKALYTVAAGFKPNRILQTHGFTPATRMVVFDYSAPGLAYRRMLHEEWDGVHYPSFLRKLFRKIPPGEAHYLLWEGMTPDTLDWSQVERRWQWELDSWGGQDALHQHWKSFQRMNIEYLHCDALGDNEHLINAIDDEENSLIWWSNAFFSVYSNWRYSGRERQEIYRRWIEKLARKAPRLLLYGSDCHNISVNFFAAVDYAGWLRQSIDAGHDELNPGIMNRYELRY